MEELEKLEEERELTRTKMRKNIHSMLEYEKRVKEVNEQIEDLQTIKNGNEQEIQDLFILLEEYQGKIEELKDEKLKLREERYAQEKQITIMEMYSNKGGKTI